MKSIAELGAAGLRLLPPEFAHDCALAALRAGFAPRLRGAPALHSAVAGLDLRNPIGLAAGFDKNAYAPRALLNAGFGFVECGTVTPLPQSGNPRPRLFRLAQDGAVINRMGFNNEGLDGFVDRLARCGNAGIVGANVGANKDSPDRIEDYVQGMSRVWPFASYITLNVSSPNTPGLRGLQERGPLEEMLARAGAARAALSSVHGVRPLFLKVAPDLDERAVRDITEIALGAGIAGLIVSNTTIERPAALISAAKAEPGGLSGRPLFAKSTALLKLFAQASEGKIALIGVGGVEDGATALAKIKAGAGAVQLYTALAYEGPALVGRVLRDLAARLQSEGFTCVREAIGADL